MEKEEAEENIFKDIDTKGNIKTEQKNIREENW